MPPLTLKFPSRVVQKFCRVTAKYHVISVAIWLAFLQLLCHSVRFFVSTEVICCNVTVYLEYLFYIFSVCFLCQNMTIGNKPVVGGL